MNVFFKEIFVDEVYHLTSVVEAISTLNSLLKLLISLFKVTKDIVCKPTTPASVSAGEEVPMFFFLFVFRVASRHQILNLFVVQFHLNNLR
ncbi:Uncharacterised protein [Escherichia coli]|nr:Uncharacterised protein [Escherichia coli]